MGYITSNLLQGVLKIESWNKQEQILGMLNIMVAVVCEYRKNVD